MATRTVSVQQIVDIVDVVMTLPPDRLASVYDFARFVQSQSSAAAPLADIFGETEEEIRADQEQWEQEFAESREQLRALARDAAAEYRAGRATPMAFSTEGRLTR